MMHEDQLAYTLVAPAHGTLESIYQAPVDLPFAECTLEFINELSKTILTKPHYAKHPEILAMAFWMRKASILKLKQEFVQRQKKTYRLPRGLVFHIAPANVDIMFMYSWLLSMLVGNKNIVRLPSKPSPQIALLVELINHLLNQTCYHSLRQKIALIRYEHNEALTQVFSKHCDTRIIWGGNQTIQAIRNIPIPAHANELCFANKSSLALLKADKVLSHPERKHLVQQFYNDTYWYSQQACSSPKFIFWLGSKRVVDAAQALFWPELEKLIQEKKPSLEAGEIMNKLEYQQALALEHAIKIEPSSSNYCNRLSFVNTDYQIMQSAHCGSGLFCETRLAKLSELAPFLNRQQQTLSCFGLSKQQLRQFIITQAPQGLDRIVAMGKALEFSAHWDGYDLLSELSREVHIAL